ncbi:nitroreductase/quinone reductase family protein [Actinomadura litoris]|uniref:nitroreductase/quinone reductase family protein n=1 Tax=Actinomadura litoris TaxID=2678616 RepID=UPI001FA79B4F|nr:nitroreductase/quinone reductase family protein [Actinomadura litoris]
MTNEFNRRIIEEFRAKDGRVGGPFEGGRLVLLTTTGARTGARHTTPLAYFPDAGQRIHVIASAGGAPRHPAWYRNLLADPRATVETGLFTYEARAAVLDGAERDAVFARAVEADPGWAEYEAAASRTLPVVALDPAFEGPPQVEGGPAAQLVRVHDAFRRELELIRTEVARSGSTIGAQLRVNCLALCEGLGNHHAGEDQMLFPILAERYPGLGEALDVLRDEHRVIERLLEDLRAVLAAPSSGPAALAAEVERLTTDLEAHLDHEEERLVQALAQLTPDL